MTLVFGDANSKLFDLIGVADVEAKEHVDYSLVEILKLRFCGDFEPCFRSRY